MKTIAIKAYQIIEGDLLQNGLHFDRVDEVLDGPLGNIKVRLNDDTATRIFNNTEAVRVRR